MFSYSYEEIENRIDVIKERYGNFDIINVLEQNGAGLFLEAHERTGNPCYLRLNVDGKIFVQSEGRWKQVSNFLYRKKTSFR